MIYALSKQLRGGEIIVGIQKVPKKGFKPKQI